MLKILEKVVATITNLIVVTTTTTTTLLIPLVILRGTFSFLNNENIMALLCLLITTLLITVSIIATIFSGYEYIKEGKDLFKDKEKRINKI